MYKMYNTKFSLLKSTYYVIIVHYIKCYYIHSQNLNKTELHIYMGAGMKSGDIDATKVPN